MEIEKEELEEIWKETPESLSRKLRVPVSVLYYYSNNTDEHYRVFRIPKKNGKFRTIEAPEEMLKSLQRDILDNVLPQGVHPIAKAFEPGTDIIGNAVCHTGKKTVLGMDLKDFFPSIKFRQVCECLREIGYSRQVAALLTGICTLDGHLPQGAPTSPHLANMVLYPFDMELAARCHLIGYDVTRYADDITISGDFTHGGASLLEDFVRDRLKKFGLRINPTKTRVRMQGARHEVTGLIVNDRIGVPRSVRRAVRQKMYYFKKFGTVGTEPACRESLQSLMGTVGFINFVEKDNREFLDYAEVLRMALKECA